MLFARAVSVHPVARDVFGDAARLVALRAQDVQPAERDHFVVLGAALLGERVEKRIGTINGTSAGAAGVRPGPASPVNPGGGPGTARSRGQRRGSVSQLAAGVGGGTTEARAGATTPKSSAIRMRRRGPAIYRDAGSLVLPTFSLLTKISMSMGPFVPGGALA